VAFPGHEPAAAGPVATEIAPKFPAQFPEVSCGIGMPLTLAALVATPAAIHYWIPTNAAADATWRDLDADRL
jgi:hypothetical protein